MPEANAFGLKFDEAIRYFKAKIPEGSMAWDDLAGPVHAKVFTVAGSMTADVSRDIHQALTSALENGTTLAQFRKDFDKIVAEHGWSYKGKRGWRTAVIFDNNMRSAHMAGRWQQLIDNQDRRPYLQYRTAGDARVRPQHRQLNGLVYRIDDSFWQTHYPPNGWGCRCTVRALSDGDLTSRNLQVSEPFKVVGRTVISRAGEIKDVVPEGIDPGWDHNVGQAWLAPELALGKKLAQLPPELRGQMIDKTISPAFQSAIADNFKAFREGIERPSGQAQIVGLMDSAVTEAVARALPEQALDTTAISVLDRKTLHLSGTHRKGGRADRQNWPDSFIDALPQHLRNYRAVLLEKETGTLVVVPQESFTDRPAKIVIRLNDKTRLGISHTVISLGSAAEDNLREAARYELLLGGWED